MEEKGSYASLLLDVRLKRSPLPLPEKRLSTELVYGVLRHRGRIDWFLEKVSHRPLEAMGVGLRNLLRLGIYQLCFLEKIPAYAAVNEAVTLAARFGGESAASFTNAVLREICRQRDAISYPDPRADPVGFIAAFHSHPRWLVERWVHRFGQEEATALAAANNQEAPVVVRANPLKCKAHELQKVLQAQVESLEESPLVPETFCLRGASSIWELDAFHQGWFAVMDEAAVLVVHLLDPQPGELILDACAGAGGKAALAAMLTQDRANILALDVNERALARLRENCLRLGVQGVKALFLDARQAGKRLSEKVNRILVDAPCTGLGTLRRHPEIKWRLEPNSLKRLPELQLELLEGVLPCLRLGGVLVYSTCSTEPEENEEVIARLLQNHPELELEDPTPYLPLAREGLVRGGEFLQTYPQRQGIDGFFAARLRIRDR
ncbi:MAG: 16S rRNA (cytosine(967)-C(5))-methyltransferase RsmB [candidate division NC10 bacterium]|nr:16S rRNA (cytosine(967)-C(5))-methyltransferase RsmB [candidate division NC10 bacterium]